MRIKDAIYNKKLSKRNIKDLRAMYNSVIDSVFYLTEDLENLEKLMNDKLIHRSKLQLQARLIDQYINELLIYDYDKNNRTQETPNSKVTLQHLIKLSELSEKIPAKQRTTTKIQKKE